MKKDIHFIRLMRAGRKLEFTHRTAEYVKETEKTVKGIESFEGIELKRERIVQKNKLDKVIDLSNTNGIDIFQLEAVTLDESKVSQLKEEMLSIVSDKIEALRVDAVNLERDLSVLRKQEDDSFAFEIRCKHCGSTDVHPTHHKYADGTPEYGFECRNCEQWNEMVVV